MKYSDIKKIKKYCESLDSQPDYRKVLDNIIHDVKDFEVNSVRFIQSEYIDQIQQEELKSDLYVLGCFNSNFLSGILDIDVDVIDSMREAEAFEAIGKLILSLDKLEEVQLKYKSMDGYGHHFNYHDFSEDEFHINGTDYYVFDNR